MIPEGNPKEEGCRGKGCPLHGEGNGGSAFLWVLISDIKQSSSVACGPGHLDFSHSNIRCDAPGHLDFSRSDSRDGGPGQVIISKLCRHSHGEPRNRKPVDFEPPPPPRGWTRQGRPKGCLPRWCALPSPRRPDLTPAAVWRGIRQSMRRPTVYRDTTLSKYVYRHYVHERFRRSATTGPARPRRPCTLQADLPPLGAHEVSRGIRRSRRDAPRFIGTQL